MDKIITKGGYIELNNVVDYIINHKISDTKKLLKYTFEMENENTAVIEKIAADIPKSIADLKYALADDTIQEKERRSKTKLVDKLQRVLESLTGSRRKVTKEEKIIQSIIKSVPESKETKDCFYKYSYADFNGYIHPFAFIIDKKKSIDYLEEPPEDRLNMVKQIFDSNLNREQWNGNELSIEPGVLSTFIRSNKPFQLHFHAEDFNITDKKYLCYDAKLLQKLIELTGAKRLVLGRKISDRYMLIVENDAFICGLLPGIGSSAPTEEEIYNVKTEREGENMKKTAITEEKSKVTANTENTAKVAENEKTAFTTREINAFIKSLDNADTWGTLVQRFYAASEQLHPCKNGDLKTWDKLTEKFSELYAEIKDWHRYSSGVVYHETTHETDTEIIHIIDTINRCPGLGIEIVGRFMWTKGKQKEYKKVLNDLGFSLQENKGKFCKSYKGYQKNNNKRFSFAQIKKKYQDQETAI